MTHLFQGRRLLPAVCVMLLTPWSTLAARGADAPGVVRISDAPASSASGGEIVQTYHPHHPQGKVQLGTPMHFYPRHQSGPCQCPKCRGIDNPLFPNRYPYRPAPTHNPHRYDYTNPMQRGGRGLPKLGTYSAVYPVNPWYSDPRDGRVYSAGGTGMPMSVPLGANVEHTYNYGWGIPSSRLTPLSRMPADFRKTLK